MEDENLGKAEQKNAEAREFAKKNDFVTACYLLTTAIELCPNVAKYYSNRAMCNLQLKRLNNCFNDCKQAQEKDPTFLKAFVREAYYHIAKGEFGAAVIALDKVRNTFPDDDELKETLQVLADLKDKETQVRQIMSSENIDCVKAVTILKEILTTSVIDCNRLNIILAECLVLSGDLGQSKQLLSEIQNTAAVKDPDVLYVEGLLFYFNDHLEDAKKSLRDVIRIAPDFQKAKAAFKNTNQVLILTKAVETALEESNFKLAYFKCKEALAIKIGSITKARLLALNGKIYFKEGLFPKTIEECNQALSLNSWCSQAYFLRARCYFISKKYEEALFDYEQVCMLDSTVEKEQMFDDTAKLFEATLTSDLKYLNVSEKASKAQIRKRFRELSKKYHPDHHMKSPRKEWFEKMYRNILDAYSRIEKNPNVSIETHILDNENDFEKQNDRTIRESNTDIDCTRLEINTRDIFQQKKPDYKQALENIKILMILNPAEKKDDWATRRKLECLLHLEQLEEAEDVLRTISSDDTDEEVLFFRGLLLFYKDEMEQAKNVFNAVKKIAPDYIKLRPFLKAIQNLKNHVETAKKANYVNDLDEATLSFNRAIALEDIGSVTKANLYHSRAKMQFQSNRFGEAIQSCNKALELVTGSEIILITKAECHLGLNSFDEAALEYNCLFQTTKKNDYEIPLSDVVSRSNQVSKTFYELAGLEQTASTIEIKQKFDRLVRLLHAAAQEEGPQQRWFFERFKLFQDAFKTLLDGKLRTAYDKKLNSENQYVKPKVKNYYTILDAKTTDSQEEIQKKYMRAIKAIHPDNSDPTSFAAKYNDVQEAYRVLSDATMRQHYHRQNPKLFNT